MSRDRFNSEGYSDPTHFRAMTHLQAEEKQNRFRPIVFICAADSGNTVAGTEATRGYCRYAVEHGYIPLAPQLLFSQFLEHDTAEDRQLALFMELALLSKCRELWVFGEVVSRGMKREIDKANYRCMPVRYFNTQYEEVSSHA